MNIDELIKQCKALRSNAERAEVDFFLFLVTAETKYAKVWKDAGCETFDQFLGSNDLCETHRYWFFAEGFNRVGAEKARAHGVHWVIEAGKMRDPSPKRLAELSHLAEAFKKKHGTSPSELSAERMRRNTDVKADQERNGETDREKIRRLEAENRQLKAELRAAKATIEKLKGKPRPRPRAN